MKTKARRGQGRPLPPGHRRQLLEPSQQPLHSPLGDVLSRLEEACMVILLQRVFCLGDERRRPLDALFAVGNLLSQLAKPHHLEHKNRETVTRVARSLKPHQEGPCWRAHFLYASPSVQVQKVGTERYRNA